MTVVATETSEQEATGHVPVLRARQASVAASLTSMPEDVLMKKAEMISVAGDDILPKQFVNNPGACMLLVEWAHNHNVSILEAIGSVSFVHGSAVVSATMQKRMAAKFGYRVEILDSSKTSATVQVHGPDGPSGEPVTYTFEMAEGFGLVARSAASGRGRGTDFWSVDPEHMLIKRATTRALEHYGPDGIATMFEELDDELDQRTAEVGDAVAQIEANEPTEADAAAQDTEPAPSDFITLDQLKEALKAKGLSQADGIKEARKMHPDVEIAKLDIVVANQAVAMDVMDWLRQL